MNGQKRRYTRISPANYQVMVRLHEEYGLTYAQIADLFDCSRSRVVQLVTQYRDDEGVTADVAVA